MIKIIISSAKTLNTKHNNNKIKGQEPIFLKEAKKIASTIKKLNIAEVKQMLKVSDKLSEENYSRFQKWESKNHNEKAFISGLTYLGDVHRAMLFNELNAESQAFLNQRLFVVSGLYGLLKPFDYMLPYRLEMSSKLLIKDQNLTQYWQPKITKFLKQENADYIINLASNEYSKAIDKKQFKDKWIDIEFRDDKNGELKIIGIFAKRARGLMAKFIAENKIDSPEQLIAFDTDGYSYNYHLSSENKYVFSR